MITTFMKVYKVNSFTTFLIAALLIGLVVFMPILLIEALWNSTVAQSYSDYVINFWQALILWLVVIVLLNIIGIFKFEFAIETADTGSVKKKLDSLQGKQSAENSQNLNNKKEVKENDQNS